MNVSSADDSAVSVPCYRHFTARKEKVEPEIEQITIQFEQGNADNADLAKKQQT